jgi:Cu(I)/Ag(I) efflux system periplasmic protein CusF
MEMTNTRHILIAIAMTALAGSIALPAHAQSATPTPADTAAELAEAEVRKVDKENRKLTLRHGPIKSLDMPSMTMVFQVADASMLDKVQAGDKIRFRATNEAGKLTVTEIQGAK